MNISIPDYFHSNDDEISAKVNYSCLLGGYQGYRRGYWGLELVSVYS